MANGEFLDLVAKYGPAVAEFIGANRSANQFQDAMSEEAISDQFDDLRENLPQYDVGPAFRKYLATAMENPVADAARRRLDETKATTIDALGQTPQGAQNLIKALRQIEGAEARIDAKEQADLNKALAVFAQQEQMADRLNTQAQQRIDSAELAAQRQAALQSAIVDAQRRRATAQAIGKGLELLGDIDFNNETDSETPQVRSLLDGLSGLSAAPMQPLDPIQTPSNPVTERSLIPSNITFSQLMGNTGQLTPIQAGNINPQGNFDFSSLMNMVGPTAGGGGMQLPRGFNFADLFARPRLDMAPRLTGFKEGGMMTPGAFSHESNPIDVVQDGTKIAELTGGEIVLNPDQSNQVAKESSFFRKLRRKFKKAQQKRENES